MSSNLIGFFESVGQLSSGTEEEPTIFSYLFDLLGNAGEWAGAVASLIGLVN